VLKSIGLIYAISDLICIAGGGSIDKFSVSVVVLWSVHILFWPTLFGWADGWYWCVMIEKYTLFGWADGWYWFVMRDEYCWLVGDRCWFGMREKHYWLADKLNEQWSISNLWKKKVSFPWLAVGLEPGHQAPEVKETCHLLHEGSNSILRLHLVSNLAFISHGALLWK